jgi:hypothetical protein
MGLFSLFRRKKKNSGAQSETAHREAPPIPVKQWHHTLSHFYLETHPLGHVPGTDLERQLVINVLISLSDAISLLENEAQESTSPFFTLSQELHSKAREIECTVEKLEVIGLSLDVSHGFAARVSANSRKYTVLLGESSAVARASTPFNGDLQLFLQDIAGSTSAPADDDQSRTFVLAVDGIAYSALNLQSELR